MKQITNTAEFEKLAKYTNSYKITYQWGLLFRFLLVICRLLDTDSRKPKKARKPSAWSKFLGDKLREGKTIQEAAALWKEKKPTLS